MTKNAEKARRAATAVLVAALAFSGVPARANPDMATDFQAITDWLSHELVQGLGFNAGETSDPPREVTDKRLQPDVSLGLGHLPLDKSKFPKMQVQQLKDLGPASIFPSAVNFPNLVAHLRGGLPWRMDFAVRGANMTTPPGYKISPTTKAKGQSNSIGFTLRKHVLGGDLPLVSLGMNYNHVYGNFAYRTVYNANGIQGWSGSIPINGALQWNVNSYGLNAVVSQRFGRVTPFVGLGYNYLTGSVRAHLEADPETDLFPPFAGESSQHPEQSQARVLFGAEMDHQWMNWFFNAEIKTVGTGAGKSWIAQTGISLPFHIGTGSGSPYASSRPKLRRRRADDEFVAVSRADAAPVVKLKKRAKPERSSTYPVAPAPQRSSREMFNGGQRQEGSAPTLIFIQ